MSLCQNPKDFEVESDSEAKILKKATAQWKVEAMISYAGTSWHNDFSTEHSHHHGISNFREVGAVLINWINRRTLKDS